MHELVKTVESWKCYRRDPRDERPSGGQRWAVRGSSRVEHLERNSPGVLITLTATWPAEDAVAAIPLEVIEFVARDEEESSE